MTAKELIKEIIDKCDDLDSEVEVVCVSFSPIQSVKEVEFKRRRTADIVYLRSE